ncbi:MAG: serine/threonine protein kinase [Byssovorax sp.]
MSARRLLSAALAALSLGAALLAGCTPPPAAHLTTPDGFAALDKQTDYVYRAASAEGVVVAIRTEENRPKSTLDFWAGALDQQLRQTRYMPDGQASDVKAQGGLAGKQLRYTRDDGGRTYRFWMTVFVTADRVWVIEAGGDKERFTGAAEERVKKAIDSFAID